MLLLFTGGSGSGPAAASYPLNDDGTLAAQFGFSHLATDAPAYNNADFAFTDAGASPGTCALPTQTNAFGIQAIPVAVNQIRYFELLFTDIPTVEFAYAGLLAIVVRDGTPIMTPITAIIRNTDGSTPQVGGDQVSYMARTEGAGYRVGIEFNGATDEVTIRSTNGVVGSFTNTALFQGGDKVFFAMIVKDSGTPVMTGETIGMTAIPAAADMWLPVTAGALDVFGTTIAMPTLANLFNAGDNGDVIYFTRPELMFQDSDGTVPVTADGDVIGKAVGLLGRTSAIQEIGAAKPIYDATNKQAVLEAGSRSYQIDNGRNSLLARAVDGEPQIFFVYSKSDKRSGYYTAPKVTQNLVVNPPGSATGYYYVQPHMDYSGGDDNSSGNDAVVVGSPSGAFITLANTYLDSTVGRFWGTTRHLDTVTDKGMQVHFFNVNGVQSAGNLAKYGSSGASGGANAGTGYIEWVGSTVFDSSMSIVGFINRDLTNVEWAYASLVAHAEVEGV